MATDPEPPFSDFRRAEISFKRCLVINCLLPNHSAPFCSSHWVALTQEHRQRLKNEWPTPDQVIDNRLGDWTSALQRAIDSLSIECAVCEQLFPVVNGHPTAGASTPAGYVCTFCEARA